MATLTRQTCPACGSRFRVQKEDGTTLVFCANGRCSSAVANDGVKDNTGETVARLAKKLVDLIIEEQEDLK